MKKEGNNNDVNSSNSSDQFQAGYSQQNLRIKEALNFFGVPEKEIDEELIRVYSGNTDLDKLTEP
jgi:Leucine-rich repeat (LRR) protein